MISVQEEDQGEDELMALTWHALLRTPATVPQTAHARELGALLENPPPLQQLKAQEQAQTRYTSIPSTPPPRRHKIDRTMQTAQAKMEACMHAIVHHIETGEPKELGVAGAWARSAWEDLQQNRRNLMAGKQAFKLDPRPDDTRPKLLTKEEEQKIHRPRPKPSASKFWGEASTFNGPNPTEKMSHGKGNFRRSSTMGKGRGKGKSS